MPAKTEKLPTVDEASADLEKANRKLADARAAVVAGDTKVRAADIAEARSAVEFAELRLELAKDADAHRSDTARLDRISEIVNSLTSGEIAAKGRQVVELEAKAAEALDALFVAASDYHEAATAALVELRNLEPLPDGVEVRPERGVKIDGALLPANRGDWAGNVIRGALYRALNLRAAGLSGPARDLLNLSTHAVTGKAGIGDRLTPADLLGQALDHLSGWPDQPSRRGED